MTVDMSTIERLGTILGVWAHPDDEAYLMGGTATAAIDRGASVACVTATAGEAGETADEGRWPQRHLATIREREMAASLAVLGIEDHEWLRFPDGGLSDVDPAHGAERVAAAIDRVAPDTVLTFGADGMTGHPDHVTISEWVTRAVAASGGRVRVLAATKLQEWYDEFPAVTREVFPDGGPCAVRDELAVAIEIEGELLSRKMGALEAQSSQTAGLIAFMGDADYRRWNRLECWVDITPAPL